VSRTLPPTLPPILLTGFEPFGGEAINPSWEAVRALHGRCIGGHPVEARQLPVAFGPAIAALQEALDAVRPTLVLAVGQAGGRARLSFERIAVNLIDARIPDNDGCQPIDCPVIAGAPTAYFTSLPVKAMRAAAEAAGVPAELSQTAGSYVCNAVFFALLHALAGRPGCRGGFVHLPWLPEQADRHPGEPKLALQRIVDGLQEALQAAATRVDDLPLAGGDTH
jgi:pyroglutamyl-peptidase